MIISPKRPPDSLQNSQIQVVSAKGETTQQGTTMYNTRHVANRSTKDLPQQRLTMTPNTHTTRSHVLRSSHKLSWTPNYDLGWVEKCATQHLPHWKHSDASWFIVCVICMCRDKTNTGTAIALEPAMLTPAGAHTSSIGPRTAILGGWKPPHSSMTAGRWIFVPILSHFAKRTKFWLATGSNGPRGV